MRTDSGTPGPKSLFARVVSETGLSVLIARGTIRRALSDVGSLPHLAQASTYLEALPAIRARLAAFLPPEEVDAAAKRIETTVSSSR